MATVGDALELAARGFRVFPLRVNDWRPALKGWQDLATTDEARIRTWWAQWPQANVGVATGKGLVVIDIDNKKGRRGSESFAALDLDLEDYDTFTVVTPSGGRHVYYRTDTDFSNSAGSLDVGLDVRGVGGYVVGPGSVLPDGVKDGQPGGTYHATNASGARSVPAPLAARLRPGHQADPRDVGGPLTDDADEGAIRFLVERAATAEEGKGGDHTTFVVAAELKDLGISEGHALDLLLEHWNDRCDPPWAPEDLKTKVANAYRYGENPAGIKSPEAQFNGVEVPELPKPAPARWVWHGTPIDRSAQWLFPEIFATTGVCAFVGPSQGGKTFLLLEASRCLATGKPFFKVEPTMLGGTLIAYAGTEGSGIMRRLAALGEDKSLPIGASQVGNLAERGALDRLLESLKEGSAYIKNRFNVPVRMIVLETIAASGLLNDENSNAEAARAITNLGQISMAMNALFVFSHHPGKGGGVRGASALVDNSDYVIELKRSGRDKVRQVDLAKGREAEQRALGSFSLVPVDLGADDQGRPITSMAVSMGEPETPAARMTKHAPLLMECIEWATAEQGREIDGRSLVPKDAVWTVFQERCKIGDKSNQHRVYRQALEFFESQGVIEYVDTGGVGYIHRRELFG